MNITQLIKSLKPYRREHWLMLCILVYLLSALLKYYFPMPICNALTCVSGLTFLCIIIFYYRGNELYGFTRFWYSILILWTVLLTLRLFFIDFDDYKSQIMGGEYHGWTTWVLSLFGSPYFLPNMMPLVLLVFPRNYRFDFKYLWRIMWLLCIAYICYYPFAAWNMTHFSWSFDQAAGTEWGEEGTYGDFIQHSTIGIGSLAPSVLMIYLMKYLNHKRWRWFIVAYIGGLIITVFLARRGGLAMSLLYLVMGWMMYSFFDKRTSKVKMVFIAVVTVALGYTLFSNTADTLFATLTERGVEDSRSGVEESFYRDMNSASDWILGRGWFGQYWEPGFMKYRGSIETGYLALILRGGLIYLIPYVLCLLISAFNGLFRSKNIFCKSFAVLCLMQVISLYPYGWPTFNFSHFILWIGIWVCNYKRFRNLTDNQVKTIYFY